MCVCVCLIKFFYRYFSVGNFFSHNSVYPNSKSYVFHDSQTKLIFIYLFISSSFFKKKKKWLAIMFTQITNHSCFTIPKLSLSFLSFSFLSKVTRSHIHPNSKPRMFYSSQIEPIFFSFSFLGMRKILKKEQFSNFKQEAPPIGVIKRVLNHP